jgi:hypothetical protein
MNTDSTFITNEPAYAEASAGRPEANLLNRFKVLIKDVRFFDSLVGYFNTENYVFLE